MIQIDTDLTTRYLQEMVRINSVNPGLVPGSAGEGEIARWLASTCESLGSEVRFQETAPNRPTSLPAGAVLVVAKACCSPGIPIPSGSKICRMIPSTLVSKQVVFMGAAHTT